MHGNILYYLPDAVIWISLKAERYLLFRIQSLSFPHSLVHLDVRVHVSIGCIGIPLYTHILLSPPPRHSLLP